MPIIPAMALRSEKLPDLDLFHCGRAADRSLIYRSALTMHEDDQLFLDKAEAHLEKEQEQLRMKQDRLQPYVNILGASSGLLVLLMAGLWLWRGFKGM